MNDGLITGNSSKSICDKKMLSSFIKTIRAAKRRILHDRAKIACRQETAEILLSRAVIVKVSQGLANQMICYKAAKLIASWNDATVILDASYYKSRDHKSDRNFQLHFHDIVFDLITFDPTFQDQVLRCNDVLQVTKEMVYPKEGFVNPGLMEQIRSADIISCDFWLCLFLRSEADEYSVRSGVIKELGLKYRSCFAEQDFACLDEINRAVNPVAIHVRRGDYATHDGGLLICAEYYNRSIENLQKLVQSPSFFVFSDDIEWCRSNLSDMFPMKFVDWNDDSKGYIDMYLGSKCKHFILSNESTYSHQMVQLSNMDPEMIVITSSSVDLMKNRRQLIID